MKLLHQTKTLLIKNHLFFIPFILFVVLLCITNRFSYENILGIPLLAIILVVYFYNKINGLILLTISIIFYIIYYFIYYINNIKSLKKEGFWSPELVREFIVTEKTINRNFVFDPSIVQEQASEDDVKYFLQNSKWYWPKEVEEIYKKAIDKNTIVRTDKDASLSYAKQLYNKTAILELLALQTDEGKLLLNGVEKKIPTDTGHQASYAYNSGLLPRYNSIIKCNMDDRNNVRMQQTKYPQLGELNAPSKEYLDYNDLENAIPGFKFIKAPCEPCVALNRISDYSCPFSIKTKDNPSGLVSEVWDYLWNLTTNDNNNDQSQKIGQINKSNIYTNNEISMITGVSSTNPYYKNF